MTFDWTTFALQLANAIILVALLRHFLFRPVAAMIAARQAQSQHLLDQATAAERAADEARKQAEAATLATSKARIEVLNEARTQAQAERAALLDQARQEAATIIEDGRSRRRQEAQTHTAEAQATLCQLATAISTKALSAQPGHVDGYVDRIAQTLAAMDQPDRQALLGGGDLRIISATDLSDDQVQTLNRHLGIAAPVEIDPTLIMGINILSDNGILRNSLADDLNQLSKAMTND